MNEIINKIEIQQRGKENTPAFMIGEQLKDIIRENPDAAEIIGADLDISEMNLDAAAAVFKQYSDKHRAGKSCFCITPDIADKLLHDFYKIPEKSEPASDFIDLASFL